MSMCGGEEGVGEGVGEGEDEVWAGMATLYVQLVVGGGLHDTKSAMAHPALLARAQRWR